VASAGIRTPRNGKGYQVWWRLDDGSQGSKTFMTKDEAKAYKNDLLARNDRGAWIDPRRGKLPFDRWADEWWEVWSTDPDRSPNTLQAAESRLRLHLRPHFGRMQLRAITATVVRRWQNELRGSLGYESVMGCRSLLHRILQAAEDDRRIEANPVRKVRAPKRPVDPEAIFGHTRRRIFTPEEFGQLLACARPFYRDHFICLVGTGLRAGEFLGLRARRVNLSAQRIEIAAARYDAGRFGSGYKNQVKSEAGYRVIPLAWPVADAIRRQLPAEHRPDDLVFTGPGGGNWVRVGSRTALSIGNLRRVYKAAATERIVHRTTSGERKVERRPRFPHLDLHGPHDLRHTFSTWLEEGGIPDRVTDELMGHEGRRAGRDGSAIGTRYRHTTPDMQARVIEVIEVKLDIALASAATLLRSEGETDRS
jgi:integrase